MSTLKVDLQDQVDPSIHRTVVRVKLESTESRVAAAQGTLRSGTRASNLVLYFLSCTLTLVLFLLFLCEWQIQFSLGAPDGLAVLWDLEDPYR
ncbi:hypothetical protein K445DRAFT_314644 [Daldinia sp. EC12]|nr:hypothetical protein K445DRAFT_314644 [Daldinia sp. EC12]